MTEATACPHCGNIHQMTCPRIKVVEFFENGVTIKRLEFHAPIPIDVGQSMHYPYMAGTH